MIRPSRQQQAILAGGLRPMRISAGAGTGKTTSVALLVADLVGRGVEPEEVLGITFTNKAAAELADKIRGLVAPLAGPGREAEVHTYHGFAAQVIREYGALVGVERDVPVITPTYSRHILFEVLRRRRFVHVDATWAGSVDRVQRLGAVLGDHLVDPVALAESASLDDPWPERLELMAAWNDYQREKRRLGVVDYTDLISSAVQLLSRLPDVAGRIRDRYRVALLDEYQDTNPAQRLMLQAIFGGGFPVVAVGDRDQTIYEWRGATPDNFDRFPRQFPQEDGSPAETRDLTVNRRSGRRIIDVANAIRSEIGAGGEDLEPMSGAGEGYVATRWAADAVAEADWIADRALQLHQQGTPWREMAVLFRKNRHMSLVHDAFSQRDVPVEVANLGGLLSVPEVADLRAWMRILHAPEDGPALLRILMGPWFNLGMGDLAHLSGWARRQSSQVENVSLDHDGLPTHTMLEAIERLGDLQGLDERARAALERFHCLYRHLVEVAHSASLAELARSILDATGTWKDVEAMSPAGRLSARLNLYRFLDLTEEWSPLEGRPSLPAFLAHLELMAENPAEELDAARLSGEDAVALLTVHRAKGLEWDVVFVPAVVKDSFPARLTEFENPYEKAHFLPHEWRRDRPPAFDASTDPDDVKEILRARHLQQEWRTAYVAVTRARHRLYLTGSHWYGVPGPTRKPAVPSLLFGLVSALPEVKDLGHDPAPPRPDVLRAPERVAAPDPLFPDGWAEAMRTAIVEPDSVRRLADEKGLGPVATRRAGDYQGRLLELEDVPRIDGPAAAPSTSVTGLVTYAACPRRHFWTEVDRLPRRPSPAARRGVDVHRRIELHALGEVPLRDLDPDAYDLIGDESHPSTGTDPYLTYLSSPYAERRAARVEAGFRFDTRAGLGVRGRIDAIYVDQDEWEIVDFKSGRSRPDPWRLVQLQAYALAAHRVDFGLAGPRRLKVSFAHLGDGLEISTHETDDGWMQGAETSIEHLAAGIMAEAFGPRPSTACRTCEFSRFCPPGKAWLDADDE